MRRLLPFHIRTIVCAAIVLIGCGNLLAQEPTPEKSRRFPDRREGGRQGRDERPPFPLPNPSFWFVSPEGRFGGKTVKGAPYSAVTEIETVQTLSDGSRIVHKTTANVYRDSEGRTRREQKLHNIGPFAPSETGSDDAPEMISINDPVAGVNYVLDPRNRTARKMAFRAGPPPTMPRPPRSSGGAKTESLGKQVIEGIEVEGTRSTITIPAGQIGNERQLEIVSERWYSAELQEVVLSKHHDPRLGDHTFRLKNIHRSEPAHTLFDVPADYTIREGGPFGGRGREDWRKRDEEARPDARRGGRERRPFDEEQSLERI